MCIKNGFGCDCNGRDFITSCLPIFKGTILSLDANISNSEHQQRNVQPCHALTHTHIKQPSLPNSCNESALLCLCVCSCAIAIPRCVCHLL